MNTGPPAADVAPMTASHDAAVAAGDGLRCPLCDYDLRGLVEPRCPECGYRFVWAELRDRTRNTHPYLFEHHPRRNIRSFISTALAGWNIPRFWRTLRPQMTPQPKRLFAYWLICSGLPVVLATALLISIAVTDGFFPPAAMMFRLYGSVLPPTPSRPAFAEMLDEMAQPAQALFFVAALIIVWTVTTHLALLLFQQSMAKARIIPIHVARCVRYSFDVGLWLALPMLTELAFYWLSSTGLPLFALGSGFLLIVAGTRLWAAYRLYLKFDRAFWVVLSSQIISLLVVAIMLLNIGNHMRWFTRLFW